MKKILVALFFSICLTGCSNSNELNQGLSEAGSQNTEHISYTNSTLGFSLTIPNTWKDFYTIYEWADGIDFYFIGESDASQGFDTQPLKGLYLFSIGKENYVQENGDFLDGITQIGTIEGYKFYSYTGTDCSMCILKDETMDYSSEELNKMNNDWEKAVVMSSEKEIVLSSFRVAQED